MHQIESSGYGREVEGTDSHDDEAHMVPSGVPHGPPLTARNNMAATASLAARSANLPQVFRTDVLWGNKDALSLLLGAHWETMQVAMDGHLWHWLRPMPYSFLPGGGRAPHGLPNLHPPPSPSYLLTAPVHAHGLGGFRCFAAFPDHIPWTHRMYAARIASWTASTVCVCVCSLVGGWHTQVRTVRQS